MTHGMLFMVEKTFPGQKKTQVTGENTEDSNVYFVFLMCCGRIGTTYRDT